MSNIKHAVHHSETTLFISDPDTGYAIEFLTDKMQTGRQRTEALIALMRAVFHEYQLCGYMTVSAKDHMAHALDTDASWNKIQFTTANDGMVSGIRLVSKLDDYIKAGHTEERAKELQAEDLNASLGMLSAMAMTMGPLALGLVEAAQQFDEKTGAIHTHVRVGDV